MTTDRDPQDLTEEVYTEIIDMVSAEPDGIQNENGNIWTSVGYLRQQAPKPATDYSKENLQPLIDGLESKEKIINWFGLIAPTTEEHLKAIIDNERMSDEPRKILIGQCNRLVKSSKELATDGGRPSDEDQQPVPERIRDVIEASDYPELTASEIAATTGLSEQQVVSTAGSMDRLELDRSVDVVRLPEDDGGEFIDDHERQLRTDGGVDHTRDTWLPLHLWWLIVVVFCTAAGLAIYYGGGGL